MVCARDAAWYNTRELLTDVIWLELQEGGKSSRSSTTHTSGWGPLPACCLDSCMSARSGAPHTNCGCRPDVLPVCPACDWFKYLAMERTIVLRRGASTPSFGLFTAYDMNF